MALKPEPTLFAKALVYVIAPIAAVASVLLWSNGY